MTEPNKWLQLAGIAVLILFFVIACTRQTYTEPHILIDTAYGEVEVELYPDKAPKTVAAFLENIRSGYYDNSSFYRVLKAEELPTEFNTGIVQGGTHGADPGKQAAFIPHETTEETGLSHTNGTISMARNEPGTASSEFFICIGDQRTFDKSGKANPDGEGYAAFGKVVKGMSVVKKIHQQPSSGDSFLEIIPIKKIKIL